MALYYGKHKVQDYDAWRPHFDNDQERLNAIGTKTISVMRSTDDPNDVHFVFDVSDFSAMIATLQLPETQEILKKAGVLEQPVLYQLQELHP